MRCHHSVTQYALRARSTHRVHHAIVEVNIVIGVVLCELHVVVRVHVPLVVCDEAVVRRTLGLIALVVIVVFVVAIFIEFCCMVDILFTPPSVTVNCVGCYRIITVILHQINVKNHSPNNWPNHHLSGFTDRSVLGPSSR